MLWKVRNLLNQSLDKYRYAMTWEELFYEDPRPVEEILEEENSWEEYEIWQDLIFPILYVIISYEENPYVSFLF